MALEKIVLVDRMEILESGQIQVQTATRILEDGVVISENTYRHVVSPGDDYTKEADNVKAVCTLFHTVDKVKEYTDKMKEKLPAFNPMPIDVKPPK